jgi:hypothetical protein
MVRGVILSGAKDLLVVMRSKRSFGCGIRMTTQWNECGEPPLR